jgi:ABC-type molybdenum transport system ATPase subunit/photorepair protein PhrA
MTLGEKFILCCCGNNDVTALLSINKEWLLDHREKHLLNFVYDYLKGSDTLPRKQFLQKKFALSGEVETSTAYYTTELHKRFIHSKLSDSLPDAVSKLKDNPVNALRHLKEALSLLDEEEDTFDTNYGEAATKRLTVYKNDIVNSQGVRHLSTGDPVLDKITYGYQKGDLWTFAGRSGMGKSWLICLLALLAESALETPGDILFISNEMDEEEIGYRMDSLRAKVGYERLLSGTLTERELKRYERLVTMLSSKGSRIQILHNCNNLSTIEAKLRVYRPVLLFIDGSYLLEPEMDEGWARIAYITRNLKSIAKRTTTPVINTTQLKRGSGKKSQSSLDGQDEFAFGMSYLNDSTFAFRMYQTPEMVYHNTIGLDIPKGRRVKPGQELLFVQKETILQNETIEERKITEAVSPSIKSADF